MMGSLLTFAQSGGLDGALLTSKQFYATDYQIKPFSMSANADILVLAVMAVLTLALLLVPFLPGLRDIPRRVPIYKLIWRDHYRTRQPPPTGGPNQPVPRQPVPM